MTPEQDAYTVRSLDSMLRSNPRWGLLRRFASVELLASLTMAQLVEVMRVTEQAYDQGVRDGEDSTNPINR